MTGNILNRKRILALCFGVIVVAALALAVFVLASQKPQPIVVVEPTAKPQFPCEIVWKYEEAPTTIEAIVYLPRKYYSAANVRQVLLWYGRQVYAERELVQIKLFVDRDLAVPTNFVISYGSNRICAPWNAHYFRAGVTQGEVEELYGYDPISWFPCWTKEYLVRDERRKNATPRPQFSTKP